LSSKFDFIANLGGKNMKRTGLFLIDILVFSIIVYAQTITITLSDDTSGRLVSTEAGVDTPAWFRSSVELRNLPWLLEGEYTGQVSWMSNSGGQDGRPGIIIFGGPNNIAASRGIFIHIGNFPINSDGCVVIAGEQIRRLHENLRSIYGGPSNRNELRTVVGRNFTIRVIDNRTWPMGNWEYKGDNTNFSWTIKFFVGSFNEGNADMNVNGNITHLRYQVSGKIITCSGFPNGTTMLFEIISNDVLKQYNDKGNWLYFYRLK
jgi:hypothetical protein